MNGFDIVIGIGIGYLLWREIFFIVDLIRETIDEWIWRRKQDDLSDPEIEEDE